jgi:hypothetical protein
VAGGWRAGQSARGGIGGHPAQALPASQPAELIGLGDEEVVEGGESLVGELGAGLGKGLLGALAHQLSLLAQMGEEQIQLALNAFAHATEHDGAQRGQRHLAAARKGARMIGMRRPLVELRGMQVLDERGQSGKDMGIAQG